MSAPSLSEVFCPQAANLVALAPSQTVMKRTMLTGGASWLDVFLLAPGILTQQDAVKLNNGEYPATAAMTTGYVFRVENQATAAYLQRIGKTGHLTTLHVEEGSDFAHVDPAASLSYLAGVSSTAFVVATLAKTGDLAALAFLGTLMAARLLNVVVIKRRSVKGWKGMLEPGVQGDLMVLVSQDKWIRMQGLVDDLKTVTSGEWLREMTPLDSFLASTASLLVYASIAFAWKATPFGSFLTAGLLALSAMLLGLCNAATTKLRMFGCILKVTAVKQYGRRLFMAQEIIKERKANGQPDYQWALRLGLIKSADDLKEVIL